MPPVKTREELIEDAVNAALELARIGIYISLRPEQYYVTALHLRTNTPDGRQYGFGCSVTDREVHAIVPGEAHPRAAYIARSFKVPE